jgi:hypothetical protein
MKYKSGDKVKHGNDVYEVVASKYNDIVIGKDGGLWCIEASEVTPYTEPQARPELPPELSYTPDFNMLVKAIQWLYNKVEELEGK